MWQRAYQRIPADIKVKFFSGLDVYHGTATNLSEKGMFIKTTINFPMKPNLRILIPYREKMLSINAWVKSFGMTGNVYNGVGVEILSPSQKYLEFIDRLRSVKIS